MDGNEWKRVKFEKMKTQNNYPEKDKITIKIIAIKNWFCMWFSYKFDFAI